MELTNLIAIIAAGIFAETSYLVLKSVQPAKVKDGVLLDTSVLIDGRIVAIARSGLVSAKLIVPTSVVRELQFMADRADHDKRERARFGLDVIEELQAVDHVQLAVVDDGVIDHNGVDEQLIKLSQKWQARLCTIDYNLNKTARVQGVQVININELAHALRVTYLPGESFDIKLQQPGQDSRQAVGYMDDGTMVVVDNAKSLIGQTIHVEATRVLQTAAGKMMFAKHFEPLPKRSLPTEPRQAKKTPRHSNQPSAKPQPRRNSNEPRTKSQQNRPRPAISESSLVDLANRS